MRKVLMATMGLALVAALIGMGVYAKWSDTETSQDNYFQAGSLDLKVNGMDDPYVPVLINGENVVPGQDGTIVVKLANEGTLDGTAYLHFMNLECDENKVIEPEVPGEDENPSVVELCGNVYIQINDGDPVTLTDLICQKVGLGSLAGGESMYVTISWEIDEDAGVGIMTDSCSFDIEFGLEQV